MDKIDILMKEIEQRIGQLESDKLIDSTKKAILIRENKRFLVRCQQLFLSAVSQQREQLAAFYEHLNDIDKPLRHGNGYKEADDFIAANCG